ncbi:MAG: GNAT family protein [Spirochaetota bacterium]
MIIEARNICLRTWEEKDLPGLFALYNDYSSLHLWSEDRNIENYKDFQERFLRRQKNRYGLFLVVEKKNTKQIIGFSYNYLDNLVDKISYLCICINPQEMRKGYGLEAAFQMLQLLFQFYGYRKIYIEIFAYNHSMLKLMQQINLHEEGRLKEFHYWQGKYWDKLIFAMQQQEFTTLEKKYKHFFPIKRHDTK